jgi:hypothetical protein
MHARALVIGLVSAALVLGGCSESGGGGGKKSSSASGGSTSSGGMSGSGSSFVGSDVDAPTITVTSPTRGAYLPAGSLTVTGTVDDGPQGSGVVAFSVNGFVVQPDPATGQWTHAMTAGPGVHTIVVRAVDLAGNVGTAALSVLAGDFRPDADVIQSAAGTRISETSLNRLAPTLVAGLTAGALTQSLTSQPLARTDVRDPVFNTCIASIEARVRNVQFATPDILFDAVPGGLGAEIHVRNFRVDANAQSYCGIPYSVTGNITANDVEVRLVLDIQLDQATGRFAVSTRSSSVTMHGFQFGIRNIPSAISNLAATLIQDELEDQIEALVKNDVPRELQQLMQQLGQSFSQTWNGRSVTFDATPGFIAFDHDGMEIGYNANTTAPRDPNVPVVPGSLHTAGGPTAGLPAFDPTVGFSVAVNENLLNRALHTSWQGGFWHLVIGQQALGSLGAGQLSMNAQTVALFFPQLAAMMPAGTNIPVAIQVAPQMQPVLRVVGQPNTFELQVGELHLTLLMDFGAGFTPVLEVALHIATSMGVAIQNNVLSYSIGGNTTFASDVLSSAVPLNASDVEAFLQVLVPGALNVVASSVRPTPLPTLQGIQVDVIGIKQSGQNGEFVTVEGNVR